MKIIYDNETDNIYVNFTDDKVIESETNPYEIDISRVFKSA